MELDIDNVVLTVNISGQDLFDGHHRHHHKPHSRPLPFAAPHDLRIRKLPPPKRGRKMNPELLTWINPALLSDNLTDPPPGDSITGVTISDLTSGTPVVLATIPVPVGEAVPTSYTWIPAAAGTYTIGVAVTDSFNQLSAYDTGTITIVTPNPLPFAAPTGLTFAPTPAPASAAHAASAAKPK